MSYIPNEQFVNIARGLVPGSSPFSGYGRKSTGGAVTNQLVWPNGTFVAPPSSGLQMTVVSSSANDSAAGTGIRTIHLVYLDSNLAPQTETITMNGVTPVNTVATNIRFVQDVHMVTYGSGKAAAGNITITNGGTIYAEIVAGWFRGDSSARMVPAGKRLMITSVSAGSSSGAAATSTQLMLSASKLDGHDYIADSLLIPVSSIALQDGTAVRSFDPPITFDAGTVFGALCTTDKAAIVTTSWAGWLENA